MVSDLWRALAVRRRTPALALAAVLVLASCGGDSEAPDGDPRKALETALHSTGPDDVKVKITRTGYEPTEVRVPVGGKVTWVNIGARQATAENVESGARKLDTHTLYRGQSKSAVFRVPGRYSYFSVYDPATYSGTIVVTPRRGASK